MQTEKLPQLQVQPPQSPPMTPDAAVELGITFNDPSSRFARQFNAAYREAQADTHEPQSEPPSDWYEQGRLKIKGWQSEFEESTPTPEEAAAPKNIEQLQAGRDAWAERTADTTIRRVFGSASVENHHFAVTEARRNGSRYDGFTISAPTLFSLEAVGIDTMALLAETGPSSGPENAVITTSHIAGDSLEIRRLRNGITMVVDTERSMRTQEPSSAIRAAVTKRMAESPVYEALVAAREKYMPTSRTSVPEVVETEAFSYTEDPWATLMFLADNKLVRSSEFAIADVRDGMSATEAIHGVLDNAKAQRREVDGTTTLTWSDAGIRRELEVNRQNGTFVFRAKRRPVDFWLERADQSPTITSLPFPETACAKALSETLDRAGLMFHPDLQRRIMDTDGDADRYGSIYTQLSREIAKWVDSQSRVQLSNLFVPLDREFMGSALVAEEGKTALGRYRQLEYEKGDDLEARVRAMYTRTEKTTDDVPSTTLFDMIDDVLARTDPRSVRSDLPVTSKYVQITDGACFDVATYYVGAATDAPLRANRKLANIEVDGVPMLEKLAGGGVHTFMTKKPIVFNGVRLPKGALFKRGEDDKWAFLRLTPFAFDEAHDQIAFGSEISKTLYNERKGLALMGEMSMAGLVRYVQSGDRIAFA